MRFFSGLRPLDRTGVIRDVLAGVSVASINIPQVLGYARIAGAPVVTGLYTVLLPLIAFAVFGSSRHLVVAADSATAAVFSNSLSLMAVPASEQYMALVSMVALLTAGFLFAARIFKLGFLADFLSRTVLAGVVLLVLLVLTGPLQYLPRCVLAAIVFTIAVGMIDVAGLRDIRHESPGEFYLAVTTAATVVTLGVEQGILLAIALSLFRHVRHSYRPHTMMLAPDAAGQWLPVPAELGTVTEPGLIVYRFGADLFYANAHHFADEVRALVQSAPAPRRCFVIDCGAVTDIDYSAAQAMRDLLNDLARQNVAVIFGRVNPYLRSDMDRHCITPVVGNRRIFATLHEAIAMAHGGAREPR
jgi:MFS superfamily sulfate permease-like transporter